MLFLRVSFKLSFPPPLSLSLLPFPLALSRRDPFFFFRLPLPTYFLPPFVLPTCPTLALSGAAIDLTPTCLSATLIDDADPSILRHRWRDAALASSSLSLSLTLYLSLTLSLSLLLPFSLFSLSHAFAHCAQNEKRTTCTRVSLISSTTLSRF